MSAVNAVAPARLTLKADRSWSRDRRFFKGMAIASAIAVFIGFYPTYYLKAWWDTPVLPPLVHVHGILFTSWIGLLVAQTWLVSVHRTDLHRRLGIGGAVAVFMTIVAFFTAAGAVQRGRIPPQFLPHSLATVLVFPALVGAALLMRRRPDGHKRLMWIATTELLSAPVGRFPVIWRASAFVAYSATDSFLATLLIYDLVTRRRPHWATVLGGSFLIAS